MPNIRGTANSSSRGIALSLVAKLLRSYLRTSLRGQTRLTSLLAHKLTCLQAVPISIEDHAPLYVDLRVGDSRDLLKGTPWESPPYEAEEQNVMRSIVRSGSVAFDIGANIGLHTVLLSKLVGERGTVYAFEPNPALVLTLSRTIGGLGNATLFPVALSDQLLAATLFVPEDHSMASLTDWTKGRVEGKAHEVMCKTCRIDDLIDCAAITQPDFIKCDVEGAELKVFQGGSRTLDRVDAPIILFEENIYTTRGFDLTASDARDFLAGLAQPQYQFFEVKKGGRLVRSQSPHPVSANTIAVPRSKLSQLFESTLDISEELGER